MDRACSNDDGTGIDNEGTASGGGGGGGGAHTGYTPPSTHHTDAQGQQGAFYRTAAHAMVEAQQGYHLPGEYALPPIYAYPQTQPQTHPQWHAAVYGGYGGGYSGGYGGGYRYGSGSGSGVGGEDGRGEHARGQRRGPYAGPSSHEPSPDHGYEHGVSGSTGAHRDPYVASLAAFPPPAHHRQDALTPAQRRAADEAAVPSNQIGGKFAMITGPWAGKTVRAELEEVQAAVQGRKFANVDRRPIDPPPVVQLRMWEVEHPGSPVEREREMASCEIMQATHLIAMLGISESPDADAYPKALEAHGLRQLALNARVAAVRGARGASTDQSQPGPSYSLGLGQRLIAGATSVVPKEIASMRGEMVVYFAFGDISVKKEGTFHPRYRVAELTSREEGSGEGTMPFLAECIGGAFSVFSTKAGVTLKESTPLTRHLREKGVLVQHRHTAQRRRPKPPPLDSAGSTPASTASPTVAVLNPHPASASASASSAPTAMATNPFSAGGSTGVSLSSPRLSEGYYALPSTPYDASAGNPYAHVVSPSSISPAYPFAYPPPYPHSGSASGFTTNGYGDAAEAFVDEDEDDGRTEREMERETGGGGASGGGSRRKRRKVGSMLAIVTGRGGSERRRGRGTGTGGKKA